MTLSRFELYETCVQSPEDLVSLLAAFHGGEPAVLGEDFCGGAALSVCWAMSGATLRAIAVDHDDEAIARIPAHDRVERVHGDVVGATMNDAHRADVIYAGNFSIGEWHDRAALLAYLRHVRARLNDGGIFVCDIYGGETAFLTGSVEIAQPGPGGTTINYTWEQREANPVTGRVVNALHFQVCSDEDGEDVIQEIRDAFVYSWRLWGVPELRDAMIEAGFSETTVFPRTPDAVDDEGNAYISAIEDPEQLSNSFDVLIVAR